MIPIEINKALSNPTRLNILKWLKCPEDNFPPPKVSEGFELGVCLILIKNKAGLSQSTISQYMAQLSKADLVTSQRLGKWTFFKRNENTIQSYAEFIKQDL